jgi:predicted Zn-dependent peptidase
MTTTYSYTTLSNSLRIVYRPSDFPVSYFGIIVDAGTHDEPPHQSEIEKEREVIIDEIRLFSLIFE